MSAALAYSVGDGLAVDGGVEAGELQADGELAGEVESSRLQEMKTRSLPASARVR